MRQCSARHHNRNHILARSATTPKHACVESVMNDAGQDEALFMNTINRKTHRRYNRRRPTTVHKTKQNVITRRRRCTSGSTGRKFRSRRCFASSPLALNPQHDTTILIPAAAGS
jgi:hypothetical protein